MKPRKFTKLSTDNTKKNTNKINLTRKKLHEIKINEKKINKELQNIRRIIPTPKNKLTENLNKNLVFLIFELMGN